MTAPCRGGGGGNGGGGGCAVPYCEQKHLCVQLRSWRTRISLLLLYMVLSMVAAMAATLSFLSPASSASGIMLEVRLIDCVLLYSHGPFLAMLFGFAPELTEPLLCGVRWLQGAMYGRSTPTQPARTMPRSFSGIW